MNKDYEIVSLGINCYVRTVLTRQGLKPRKADGELSCPFDLVFHKFDRIVHYIGNHFEDYFDDIQYKIRKRHFLDFRNKGLWFKNDGTVFTHDRDCKGHERDKLTERIQRRIKNFYQISESEIPVFYVAFVCEKTEKIPELYSYLKELRENKKFKLIILNFSEDFYTDSENIYVLNLLPPCDVYIRDWNRAHFRNKRTREYVEKCVTNYVRNIIEKNI